MQSDKDHREACGQLGPGWSAVAGTRWSGLTALEKTSAITAQLKDSLWKIKIVTTNLAQRRQFRAELRERLTAADDAVTPSHHPARNRPLYPLKFLSAATQSSPSVCLTDVSTSTSTFPFYPFVWNTMFVSICARISVVSLCVRCFWQHRCCGWKLWVCRTRRSSQN